jgi:hypothetical protein
MLPLVKAVVLFSFISCLHSAEKEEMEAPPLWNELVFHGLSSHGHDRLDIADIAIGDNVKVVEIAGIQYDVRFILIQGKRSVWRCVGIIHPDKIVPLPFVLVEDGSMALDKQLRSYLQVKPVE